MTDMETDYTEMAREARRMLERGSLRKAELERRAPHCFLNKGKKMKELAKPTAELSYEIDRLEDFFRPKSA